MSKSLTLYLAGGLFNAPDQVHILNLEQQLKVLGYKMIIPMREAMRHRNTSTGELNTAAIVEDCRKAVENPANLYVGCVDGADADSGTCVEYSHAITATKRAIVYRTDSRTALSSEVGMNAMLRSKGTELIYKPCFLVLYLQVDSYYRELAREIDQAAKRILQRESEQ